MQKSTTSTLENWMNVPSGMQVCIDNCTECYQMCSHLVDYCLKKGGEFSNPEHIKLLEDCARICNLSADFMIRHSKFHDTVCDVCAKVCKACAESCNALGKDDRILQACYDACIKCAESCAQMAKGH